MLRSRVFSLSATALVASALAALSTPLLAQSGTMRLAFGYQCGDNFVVHNDGTRPADIQYAVAGSTERQPLHLNGGESSTITSPASDPLELWVNGKRVASEPKGNRACAAPTDGGSDVIVRPLNAPSAQNGVPVDSAHDQPVYYPPYPYPDYYPYDAYSYYGYYPYYPYPYAGALISIRGGPVFRGGPIFRGPVGRGGVIGRGRGRIR